MASLVKILLVEDSEDDADLLLQELENCGIQSQLERVETRESLVSELKTQDWDIVISEYILPEFSGLDALKLVKKHRAYLPFIMISGKMEVEDIIEVLKAGAQDYVMKERLFRICPAVNQALQSRDLYLERDKAEKELQKIASQYHLLAENITDIIWTIDLERRFTFISNSVTSILGYRIEDILGKELDIFFSPHDSRKITRAMKKLLGKSKDLKKSPVRKEDIFDMEIHHKNGRPIWMETNIVILLDDSSRALGFLGVSRDITDRKLREKEISLFSTAFKQIDEGVIITDHEGIIQYVNESFKRNTGFHSKKLIGKSISVLDSESSRDQANQNFQYALQKVQQWRGHLTRQKKNGSFYQADASIYPIRDEDGKAINFVYIERDITQELKLQNKFVEMQKMEALGTLAGGIAHDFNNILMPIIVNSEMLLWDSASEDPQSEYLDQILEAAKRGKELVKQIISFSRKSSIEKKTIDLGSLIKESLSFLQATLPAIMKIDPVIEIDEVRIEGNSTQIQQVFMNLCTNAADAMGTKGGRIKITLARTEYETGKAPPDPRLKAGPYARISVEDSGPGIKPDILNKIFDPFYSTKGAGKGSGMGLSVARRIVDDHGGIITVDSEQDKGATFHVFLPLFDGGLPPADKKVSPLEHGDERILLVDDEATLVGSIQNMLQKIGYTVTGVTSSKEALNIFKSQPDVFDIVITDQVMPGLTGIDLVKKITHIRPNIPLILITGFSESVSAEETENLGIDAYLMKPVNTRKMASTIRRVIDKKK